MNQNWFEMNDIRGKIFSKAVWIPLRAAYRNEHTGKYGYEGYKEDFSGSGCIAVPTDKKEFAERLGWMDVGISHQHSGVYDNEKYSPADIFEDYRGGFKGLHLVLNQRSTSEHSKVWHLHQDLVLTLGLQREGDIWVCPEDGYTEVARLKRNDGEPVLLEMKVQYLKDYLCARDMGLYITSFFSRDAIVSNASFITWENGEKKDGADSNRWEGRIIPIHEGGERYGAKMAVFHISRTDVDETEDVPDISEIPTDENTKSESWEKPFEGKKLYRILGELWRNEWIEPGKYSPKVRRDEIQSTIFFTINAEGRKVKGDGLIHSGKWLWFKPDVIMTLSHRRGGSLEFYTQNTGSVACSIGNDVHFGINSLGYVNVYAKDIGMLPEWQQQIWAGYNATPEGGVSDELLASQVRAEPADTQAPEAFLSLGIKLINEITNEKLNFSLFRQHEIIPDLLNRVHRFRAVDEAGLFALAKDIARLTADSLDAEAMQKIVSPPKDKKWGSLKSLENLLASKINPELAREIMSALVGVYELRLADAHLPSSEINEAFKLINVDRNLPMIFQAHQMLHSCVSSLFSVIEVLKRW